ncbi:MAG: hypothetical protein ACYC6C_09045 [Coriobacteriia bacterium]
MRQLTFKGYLESYVPYLAGEDTLSLARLARHLPGEPRLVAPMLLWATVTGRGDRMATLLQSEDQTRELELLMSLQSASLLEAALTAEDPRLRPEYAKAWRSFVVRRDAARRDAELKLEARQRALDLASKKGVSRYRMARDLDLNDGNLHAFLAQGKPHALSLKRAFELVEYLEAA